MIIKGKKGLKPEAPNQDSFFVIKAGTDISIYGVFDGHGPCGHDVSEFVKNELPKILLIDENVT
jgi:serine/threonine protein phosphatase PrpC